MKDKERGSRLHKIENPIQNRTGKPTKITSEQRVVQAEPAIINHSKKRTHAKNDTPTQYWGKMDGYGNVGVGTTKERAEADYEVTRDKRHRRIDTKARLQKVFRGTK